MLCLPGVGAIAVTVLIASMGKRCGFGVPSSQTARYFAEGFTLLRYCF